MKIIRKYADNRKANSVSNRFRLKRFELFRDLICDLPKPVKILDAGGTVNFWKQMGVRQSDGLDITIMNLETDKDNDGSVRFVEGDVRDLSVFSDKEFDVVFSNSVIEHVGEYEDQERMAKETIRTGKRFFIQTPNRNFPFEPHFLFPFFQFLPFPFKVYLVRHFNMGWFTKAGDKRKAEEIVNSIRLLNRRRLRELFPDSLIVKEKFLFLTKSLIVLSKLP